jgi:hypothetical protein
MFISKHHYAIELAKRGNEVYFLNPPDKKVGNKILVESSKYDGLFIVTYSLFFSWKIRFHARWLHDFLMIFQIKKIQKTINEVDIVWCFEANLFSNLKLFKASLHIYHPVDELTIDDHFLPARNADIIFCVTEEIKKSLESYRCPKYVINHGLSEAFELAALNNLDKLNLRYGSNNPIRVGYVGNMLRPDIDHETLKKIIEYYPHVNFIFWGVNDIKDSNIAGSNSENVLDFIHFLKQKTNVFLRGPLHQEELSREMNNTDAFLICYDPRRDQCKATNYHKVIEMLSTGKVIISNHISFYTRYPDLVEMSAEKRNNESLKEIFDYVIINLDHYNSGENRRKRIRFALDNTYGSQISRIESFFMENQNE